MLDRSQVQDALGASGGLLRLEPAWVPRTFMHPGRRLRLHPEDLYALGAHRGGINERWFSSTTNADNGPGTPPDEGLSYVRTDRGRRFLLKEAVAVAGDLLLGSPVIDREGGWNVLCKFFDNMGPIPHHLHQTDAQAKLVGRKGKPEAYYFPPQYNQIENSFPYTFMGLEPGTTKDDVRRCLERWNTGDNGILYLSRAFKLQQGTGWQIDPGILHAPGSLVTYEPQVASDVFAMFQSIVEGRAIDRSLLTKDVPPDKHDDLDFLVGLLEWDANVDQEFAKHNRVFPIPAQPTAETEPAGIPRSVGVLRHGLVLGERADGSAEANGHRQGQRRLRDHPHSGLRHVRVTPRVDAGDDSLWRHDGGRTVRLRRSRARRRPDRESQRQRSTGDLEAFRPWQSRR